MVSFQEDDRDAGLDEYPSDDILDDGTSELVAAVLDLDLSLDCLELPYGPWLWSSHVKQWCAKPGRSRLSHVDLSMIEDEAWTILTELQEVKHLSFGANYSADFAPSATFPPVDDLRLKSLHVGSWDGVAPGTFKALIRSSFSTLRSLDIPWDLDSYLCDFAALTVLTTLKLSHTASSSSPYLPLEAFVEACPTFPPSLVSLSFGSLSHTSFAALYTLAEHLPPFLLHFELPSSVVDSNGITIVEHLPNDTNIRFFSIRLMVGEWRYAEHGKPKYAGTRAACETRRIGFDVQVRSVSLPFFFNAADERSTQNPHPN